MRRPRISPAKAPLYLEKGRRYAAAAKMACEEGWWDPAVSAAVHAAINMADAACVRYHHTRSTGANHHEVIKLLDELRGPPPGEIKRLTRHLGFLIGMKTLAEYEDRLLTEVQGKQAITAMQRAVKIVEQWATQW